MTMVSLKVMPTLYSASLKQSQDRGSSRLEILGALRGTRDLGVTVAQNGTVSQKM